MCGTTLVVYFLAEAELFARQTLLSHLNALRITSADQQGSIDSLNLASWVPRSLLKKHYDLIVFHYSVFAERLSTDEAFQARMAKCKALDAIAGSRVAVVQDEYVRTDALNAALRDLRCSRIYSCVPASNQGKIYDTGYFDQIETVLTGYVDRGLEQAVEPSPHSERSLDIVYRARKLPEWLGDTAKHKYMIGQQVIQWLEENNSAFNTDISCDPRKTVHGSGWLKFLANSRTVLGSESGVSLLDRHGKIHLFARTHSEQETVEYARKVGEDFQLGVISPRHFEAAQVKTCQVLVEGDYSGVLKKADHYIAVTRDYSNLDLVMSQVADVERCEAIAARTFEEVICNNKWSYPSFSATVLGDARTSGKAAKLTVRQRILSVANRFSIARNLLINFKILVVRVLLPKLR